LVCIDAKRGKLLWRCDRAAGKTAVCPTPVYSDGYVFAASGYGNGGACVKLGGSGRKVKAKPVWETTDMVCHHGGYVVVDGYLYGNHSSGWTCLDLKSGKKKWHDGGVGKGSICYADGMLYTFSEGGGKIGLVPATPDGFKLVSQFSVEGRGRSWAHPAVIGGRLYLRYGGNLYVFDVKAK
jgi:outer membrane protein assembly factor BamB